MSEQLETKLSREGSELVSHANVKKQKIKSGCTDKYNSQIVYGWCIDNNYTELLTKEERKKIKKLDTIDVYDFYRHLVKKIVMTKETRDFRYYTTDFEFSEECHDFDDYAVLIIGVPINTLKAQYSGVMKIRDDGYLKFFDNEYIKPFIENNPRFKDCKPELFCYTSLNK